MDTVAAKKKDKTPKAPAQDDLAKDLEDLADKGKEKVTVPAPASKGDKKKPKQKKTAAEAIVDRYLGVSDDTEAV